MSYKYRPLGIPFDLNREEITEDDYIYSIINTDTGETIEYTDWQEALTTFNAKIENKMLKRGFIDDDFSENDFDENIPDAYNKGIDRTAENSEIEARFDEIKEGVKNGKNLPEGSELSDIMVQNTLKSLIIQFQTKRISKDDVGIEVTRLLKAYKDFKKIVKNNNIIFRKHQQFIKESTQAVYELNSKLETATPEELLLIALKVIFLKRGELVTYNNLKKRLERRLENEN